MPCPLQCNCVDLQHAGELLYVCIRSLGSSVSSIQRQSYGLHNQVLITGY
jgi:hypothetical protein